jgi:hypothetical protein
LRSLGAKLAFNAALRPKLVELGLGANPPEPDVLLHHISSGDHLVLECKTTSFGAESSTTKQARKLLISCFDANSAFGVSGHAIVAYVLAKEDCERQFDALREIAAEVSEQGFNVAIYGTLGLEIDDKGLWAHLTLSETPEQDHARSILGPVLIASGASGDARPLYFIPFDPTTDENQTPDERLYCRKILTERFYLAGVAVIGQAEVPDCLVIKADTLFREATYGFSDKWHAKELVGLKSKLIHGMATILNKKSLKGKVVASSVSLELRLGDEEDRQTAIGLLLRANSEQLALNTLSGQIDMDNPES